jgi:hypothetical protein
MLLYPWHEFVWVLQDPGLMRISREDSCEMGWSQELVTFRLILDDEFG